jgi:hypothetical protein
MRAAHGHQTTFSSTLDRVVSLSHAACELFLASGIPVLPLHRVGLEIAADRRTHGWIEGFFT